MSAGLTGSCSEDTAQSLSGWGPSQKGAPLVPAFLSRAAGLERVRQTGWELLPLHEESRSCSAARVLCGLRGLVRGKTGRPDEVTLSEEEEPPG